MGYGIEEFTGLGLEISGYVKVDLDRNILIIKRICPKCSLEGDIYIKTAEIKEEPFFFQCPQCSLKSVFIVAEKEETFFLELVKKGTIGDNIEKE